MMQAREAKYFREIEKVEEMRRKFSSVTGQQYILRGKKPVRCDNIFKWSRFMDKKNRHVANTYIGSVRISTVFLALNHNFSDKASPLLFETMVFGGELDLCLERYRTWDGAAAGHKRWVAKVKGL